MEDAMVGATTLSRDQLVERVNGLQWAHKIDLGDGVVTPGEWGDHNPFLWQAMRDVDFTGKKVLDIGCWDGLWSFEAEKRGAADVYATDLISQRNFKLPTFELAHHALNSRVKYDPNRSVYEIEKLGVLDFDVVIFAAVYYHLKDPLRALATLRRVMKEGAIIIVEGAVIGAEPPKPEPGLGRRLRRWLRVDPPATAMAPPHSANADDCFARFYYRNAFAADDSNWWVPTVPCLRQWIECNYFEIEREYDLWKPSEVKQPHTKWDPDIHNMRYVIAARAVRRKDPLYCRPDDELAAFDLNEY
jgi:tRNA (mo5U34)-methyltransferase